MPICEIPNDWKRGNKTTISKKRKKEVLKNYRLVSLTVLPGKIMEKIYWETLLMHMENKEMKGDRQHGFPKAKLVACSTEMEPGEEL